MKSRLQMIVLALVLGTSSIVRAFDHSDYDAILKQSVDASGQVDYALLKENRSSLDAYLEQTGAISASDFRSWSEAKRLAFLINVYNGETLQLIIDHYPIASIKRIGGLLASPWKIQSVVLFGKETTLDHLEHGIIRVDFSEPRIHFALVCAAKGCPPLRREAFTESQLEFQLEDQTRRFLNEKPKNRIEGEILHLSPIFDWYGDDFTRSGNSLRDFVGRYLSGDAQGKRIRFTHYDWSLNVQ
ncbi:MAG: DUF547 domain-containing protein [Verrucomicrobiota bacterium]